MKNQHSKFLKDFFLKSRGYIPFWPLPQEVNLGDLLLIRKGQIVRIGNIFDKFFGVSEDLQIEENWSHALESWNRESGTQLSRISKDLTDPISDRLPLSEKQRTLIEFTAPGDYLFHSSEIYQRSIENFHAVSFKILQELASEKFNFTEIVVVESIAKTSLFSLMIAAETEASVLLSSPESDTLSNPMINFSNQYADWRVENMKGIDTFQIAQEGGTLFFKGQKLEASPAGKEKIRGYIQENLPESMQAQAKNILQFAPTQVLPSIEIYPSSVHELFHFREMNLNDISILLGE